MGPNETLQEYAQRRTLAMKLDRSTFDAHWRELAEYTSPRLGRFFVTDVNRGDKRHQSIVNSRATQALRSASAGLLAGVMSPTRQWFNLVTPDPDMMEFAPVKEWLYKVEQLLLTIFASSNLYTMAPTVLRELLLFGTSAMSQVDDFDDVTRFYTHTIGSYSLAQNEKFKIDTLARQFEMTVRQIVDRYGQNASVAVRNLYDRSQYEARVQVGHFVEPNENFDPTKLDSKFKRFHSVYFEVGSTNRELVLSEAGFDEFPAHCPRWDVTGEDVYATDCPGMTSLGDVKGLQTLERRKGQAIDKMVNPPLKGPPSLANVKVNSLPGGVTIYDPAGSAQDGLSPLYMVNPQVQQLVMDIEHHERRIREAYYEDLFRSIDSMEGVQPQNQLFLSMKNAEKLLQLGPVLERLHGEMLNPIVDRTFGQCLRANLLPPAPQELQGQTLRVRYISSLAMAQREVATVGIDKLTMFIGGLMQMGLTSVADKIDADQMVDEYARAIGVAPRLVVPDDQVAAVRAERAKQQQQQMAMQNAQQGASAIQQLANSPLPNGGNALGVVQQAAMARAGQAPPAAAPT